MVVEAVGPSNNWTAWGGASSGGGWGSSANVSSQSQSSGSFIPNYSESSFLQSVASQAAQMSQAMAQWANEVYAKNSQITDQVINSALATAQATGGLAATMLDRYQNTFMPLEDNLVQDANTYASDSRIRDAMGSAQAGVMQSWDQATENAERDLQRFGIDPSAGRYQDLIAASRTQAGANAAAAGQKARLDTEDRGRALRTEAIRVGQEYPKRSLDALDTGIRGLNAATQANTANAQSGATLMSLPRTYLDTAMSLRYPPLGTGPSNSQSYRESQSGMGGVTSRPSSSDKEKGDGEGRPSGGSRGGGGGGRPSGGGRGGGDGDGARLGDSGPRDTLGQLTPWGQMAAFGLNNQGSGAQSWDDNPAAWDPANWGDQYNALTNDWEGYNADDWNDNWNADPGWDDSGGGVWDYGFDDSGGGDVNDYWNQYDDYGWDDSGGGAWDYGWDDSGGMNDYWDYGFDDYGYDDYGWDDSGGGAWDYGWDDSAVSDYDTGGGWYDGGDYGWDDSGGSSYYDDYSGGGGGDWYGGYDAGGGGDYYDPEGYAAGGAVPLPGAHSQMSPAGSLPGQTAGGMVPQHASPSQGRVQDDVNAKLTPDEFVIPRDVALWKGQEYFQKLIEQSRKARTGAPAKGKPAKATGRPSFVSR